jgi:hypothetical protein
MSLLPLHPDRLRRIRSALFGALPVVATVRLALWIVPFRTTRRFVGSISPHGSAAAPDPSEVRRLVRAVRAASRLVPQATCLTQAIALHYLLARRGRAARIHIGVRRAESGGFESHAWVELDGVVVIGGGDLSTFVPLMELQEGAE